MIAGCSRRETTPTHPYGDWIVIPQAAKSVIARIDSGRIIPEGFIDLPFSSRNVITSNGLIVSLRRHPEGSEIAVYTRKGELVESIVTPSLFHALASYSNTAYFGGQSRITQKDNMACEAAAYINVAEKPYQLRSIKLPAETKAGKSIDDVLIRADSLYLVDNLIFPKYMFVYSLTDPNAPEWFQTVVLENHGTYERISRGDISEKYCVLLSSTAGLAGSGEHISIYGDTEGIISAFHPRAGFCSGLQADSTVFMDIGLAGNNLFILTNQGIFKLDLKKAIRRDRLLPVTASIKKPERLIKTPNGSLIATAKEGYELIHFVKK